MALVETVLLGGGRAAFGLGCYAAPSQVRSLTGFAGYGDDASLNHTADTMSRLFGIRDLMLGLGYLTSDPDVRRAVVFSGAVIDTADALAMGVQYARGQISAKAAAIGAGGAALFALIGWYLVWKDAKAKNEYQRI